MPNKINAGSRRSSTVMNLCVLITFVLLPLFHRAKWAPDVALDAKMAKDRHIVDIYQCLKHFPVLGQFSHTFPNTHGLLLSLFPSNFLASWYLKDSSDKCKELHGCSSVFDFCTHTFLSWGHYVLYVRKAEGALCVPNAYTGMHRSTKKITGELRQRGSRECR